MNYLPKILISWLAILAIIALTNFVNEQNKSQPISFEVNANGEVERISLDDILPENTQWSMVTFGTPNGDVVIGNTELQGMTLQELKNFDIMISICTKVYSSPETVETIGKKLLPRFFNK